MDCREARPLLDAYLDGELGVERGLEIEAHLAACPNCAAVLASGRALSGALRRELPYHPASARLRGAILDRIERETLRRPAAPPQWLRLAASLVLVAGLSAGLTYYVTPRNANLVSDEVFASHVRGMLSENRLIDVASSDEHTVKPWFDTKIDFSPPVKDLTTEGFPLIGGRLDYIGGRNVAALVYHHRKHVITLFIWPTTARTDGVATSVRQGDNLVHWSDGAMTYWAVSDLNLNELLEFCKLVRAAPTTPPAGGKQP
ncbi:MAG TPA: anti-sigma factor [Alphaproteobacteria bacterium]|nr:anti-sigma factor [Alphaproteobacteria bacterium]